MKKMFKLVPILVIFGGLFLGGRSKSVSDNYSDSESVSVERQADKYFLYFAYGSNMWSERIKINTPDAVKYSIGMLNNYRLEFGHFSKKWNGSVASIAPKQAHSVPGVLWSLSDLKALDKQEGVGINIYERFKVHVISGNRLLQAWTYKLTKPAKQKAIDKYGPNVKPKREYVQNMINGALENKLPGSYIQYLRKIPTTP